MNRKRVLFIISVVLMVLIAIWILSLIKNDILTLKYHDDFAQAYTQNTMLGEMEYFKVLRCDGKNAEVYYVSKDMTGANVLTFEKKDGVWQETAWETIWSTSGSASEVIYPYWWHFIYGGF